MATERTAGDALPQQSSHRLRVSVVIPCLNEETNIEECVTSASASSKQHGIAGEVIVADNGSEDRSAELAAAAGATVVHEPRRGYGSAYLAGFAAARGDYIVMIDADLTYDFEEIPNFVRQLDEGADLVMGNRMANIEPGAMSLTSRIGNPILSGFLNLVYRTPVGDAHCGLRAIRRDALPKLDLHSTGMEFASEMVIRAVRADLDIREQPISLHVRGGESKLSPLRDGWRHLRLMLVYSPGFLFLIPGAVMVVAGVLIYRHCAGEDDDLRPAVLHPRRDRRLDARHRRDRGDRPRPDRPHVRLLLHGRARPVPRAVAPRGSGSSTA